MVESTNHKYLNGDLNTMQYANIKSIIYNKANTNQHLVFQTCSFYVSLL